jgi:hypothetical protein
VDSSFWSGLVGVLVGGALSLGGVLWTLRRQEQRDEKADARALRDAKHLRIRSAYAEIISAVYHYVGHADALAVMESVARHQAMPGAYEAFLEMIGKTPPDVTQARIHLLLEAPEDQAVLNGLQEIAGLHSSFIASMAVHMKEDDGMPASEYEARAREIHAKAETLLALARDRLARLERPVGPE